MIIAYACSHIVIIYNYETKEAINLQGHVYIVLYLLCLYFISRLQANFRNIKYSEYLQKNIVKTLSTSRDGKWLLSADFEDDCVVVVWDTETG